MLNLNLSANNYAELIDKIAGTLGLQITVQGKNATATPATGGQTAQVAPVTPAAVPAVAPAAPAPAAPGAEPVAQTGRRGRPRTVKPEAPSAPVAPEPAAVAPIVTAPLPSVPPQSEPVTPVATAAVLTPPAPVAAPVAGAAPTYEAFRENLQRLVKSETLGLNAVVAILEKHGEAKVKEVPAAKYAAIMADADAALASATKA